MSSGGPLVVANGTPSAGVAGHGAARTDQARAYRRIIARLGRTLSRVLYTIVSPVPDAVVGAIGDLIQRRQPVARGPWAGDWTGHIGAPRRVRASGVREPHREKVDAMIDREPMSIGIGSTDEAPASDGSPYAWLPTLVAVGLLVFMGAPLERVLREPISSAARVATYGGLAIFVLVYLWAVLGDLVGHRAERLAPGVIVLAILAIGITLLDGRAIWTVLFIAAAAGAGRMAPSRTALVGVVLASVLAAAVAMPLGMEPIRTLESSIEVLLVGFVVLGFSQTERTARRLQVAQAEIAQAATDRERARIARDLHDLLGHSLSMVALKTELARKLIDRDPERASAELGDVEDVVRTSLRDVRQTVAGYPRVDLQTELDAARVALVAAGFDVLIERPEERLEPSLDALLGWVVREGVTNVVRHSRGGQCSIEIDEAGEGIRLEILDDGPAPAPGAQARPSVGTGRGLRGIRERVEQVGGQIESGWRATGGFALTVTVPARVGVPVGSAS